MWVLVFIYFYDTVPYVETVSVHNNMIECFYARDGLSEEVGLGGGYFDPGQQALCISMTGEPI